MTERKLTKRELDLLGRAFEREIIAATRGEIDLLQTKSKLARRLVDLGMLEIGTLRVPDVFGVIKVVGYRLTHAGRIAYCESCEDA